MFLKDIIKNNGDKLVHYTEAEKNKKYMSIFNYSQKNGGTVDSFKYYNDYVVEIKEDLIFFFFCVYISEKVGGKEKDPSYKKK